MCSIGPRMIWMSPNMPVIHWNQLTNATVNTNGNIELRNRANDRKWACMHIICNVITSTWLKLHEHPKSYQPAMLANRVPSQRVLSFYTKMLQKHFQKHSTPLYITVCLEPSLCHGLVQLFPFRMTYHQSQQTFNSFFVMAKGIQKVPNFQSMGSQWEVQSFPNEWRDCHIVTSSHRHIPHLQSHSAAPSCKTHEKSQLLRFKGHIHEITMDVYNYQPQTSSQKTQNPKACVRTASGSWRAETLQCEICQFLDSNAATSQKNSAALTSGMSFFAAIFRDVLLCIMQPSSRQPR